MLIYPAIIVGAAFLFVGFVNLVRTLRGKVTTQSTRGVAWINNSFRNPALAKVLLLAGAAAVCLIGLVLLYVGISPALR